MNEVFHKVSTTVSRRVGSSSAFIVALSTLVLWGLGGLSWGFSDSWLLLLNTTCSVITFLIVFLIQNTQNRNNRAMQLKLDELLKAEHSARTDLVNLEELTDRELDDLQEDFRRLRLEFLERQAQLVARRVRKTKHQVGHKR